MKFTSTSFPSVTIERFICPLGITTFPLNPTSGVSYLLKSFGFNPSPLYRLRYMISIPLPWSIITLFTKNPPIRKVTTKASSCGWDVPSKFVSPKMIGTKFLLSFFSGRFVAFALGGVTTLNMSLRCLTLTLMEVAWMASIIPRVGEVCCYFGFLSPSLHLSLLGQPEIPSNATPLQVASSGTSTHGTIR